MSQFKFEPISYNGMTGKRATFSAKLVSPLSEVTKQNSNGNNYKIGTIEFADANGELQRVNAISYENNYKHGIKAGEKYQCQVTIWDGNDQPFVTISHLVAGGTRATFDMFGIATEVVAEGAE